jgi:hypothetical protein
MGKLGYGCPLCLSTVIFKGYEVVNEGTGTLDNNLVSGSEVLENMGQAMWSIHDAQAINLLVIFPGIFASQGTPVMHRPQPAYLPVYPSFLSQGASSRYM